MIRVPIVQQSQDHNCGEAVVESILKHYQVKISRFKFSSEVDGTAPRTIEHQLRINGFYVIAGNFGWTLLKYYIRKKIPVIVCKNGHWLIVCGIQDRSVLLMDPEFDDYQKQSIRKFKEEWNDFDSMATSYKCWGIVANPSYM